MKISCLYLRCMLCLLPVLGFGASGEITVVPKPSNKMLINPGKGWVLYGLAEWQDASALAVGSIGYRRFAWSEIERSEGQYDWEKIEHALAGWAKIGWQFSFGVMCANSHSKDPYVTPKWVFDAGAKCRMIDMKDVSNPYAGVPGQKAVPDFYDPVFLEKLRNFLFAMGKKFDGDGRIAFIDIRSYGNWGEGHMHPFGGKGLTAEEFKHHVQMHLDSFKKTRLCISAEAKAHQSVYDWAVQQGVAARRDGICGNSDGHETLRAFGYAPGVFEFFGSYSWMKEKGWWDGKGEKGCGHTLVDCVENGKPSYIGLSHGGKEALKFLAAERPLIEKLANRMGYHFVLKEAAFPEKMTMGSSFTARFTWFNEGVAQVYVPCVVALALLDESDIPVDICWPEACRPSRWMPDKPVIEETKVLFRKHVTGDYRFAVALVEGKGADRPVIRLGIDGSTVNGWYPLGKISVSVP